MFLTKLYVILFATLSIASPSDWKTIENLIEQTPNVVALLNYTFQYICTGTVITQRTVLTSGSCVNYNPKRVAVGVAVVGAKTSKNSILDVAYTRMHDDYSFELKAAEPNVTRMHSNIGLVFVAKPMLLLYIPAADLGKYFASELQNIELTTVGFGEINGSPNVVLQYQNYNQAPCANPRWYYCICGVEDSNKSKTYDYNFGNGAPVLFGNEVVGVAASASGTLSLRATDVKYNVFTVIGPYLSWIEKVDHNMTLLMRARSEAFRKQDCFIVIFVCVLPLINKMCY